MGAPAYVTGTQTVAHRVPSTVPKEQSKDPEECLWYEQYTRRQKGAGRTRYAMRQLKEDDPWTGHEAVMCCAVFTCGHRGSTGTVTGIKGRGGRGRGTSVGGGGLRAEQWVDPEARCN